MSKNTKSGDINLIQFDFITELQFKIWGYLKDQNYQAILPTLDLPLGFINLSLDTHPLNQL